MRILLTGATGFIGKHLLKELLKNHKVVAIARNPLSMGSSNLKVIYGNLLDKKIIEDSMKNIDIVIHLAASLDQSDKNIEEINVTLTKTLIEEAKKAKIKKFIFFSTEKVPHSYCNDSYTISKRKAETIVTAFKNHLILRPSLVYGPGDTKYISILLSIIRKHPIVPIIGTGNQLLQPIFVKDLVKAVVNGIKNNIKGTYLLAGPEPISYNNIVQTLINELGLRRITIHIPILIIKPLIFIAEILLKNPPLRISHLEVLKYDKIYTMSSTLKLFKYVPTRFKEGCKAIIRAS